MENILGVASIGGFAASGIKYRRFAALVSGSKYCDLYIGINADREAVGSERDSSGTTVATRKRREGDGADSPTRARQRRARRLAQGILLRKIQ